MNLKRLFQKLKSWSKLSRYISGKIAKNKDIYHPVYLNFCERDRMKGKSYHLLLKEVVLRPIFQKGGGQLHISPFCFFTVCFGIFCQSLENLEEHAKKFRVSDIAQIICMRQILIEKVNKLLELKLFNQVYKSRISFVVNIVS